MTVYLVIFATCAMCILGIKRLVNDIDELRFNELYFEMINGDFRRLTKAAYMYNNSHCGFLRSGKLSMAMLSFGAALVGISTYVFATCVLDKSFKLLIALAIAIILFSLSWFDLIVSDGMFQLEVDEAHRPVTWY